MKEFKENMSITLRQLAAELLRDAHIPDLLVGPGTALSFSVEDGEAAFEWSDEGFISAYLHDGPKTILDILTTGSEDDPDEPVDLEVIQKNGEDESLEDVISDFREAVRGRRPDNDEKIRE